MIIKATFNDNDFTQVLEQFFEQPLLLGAVYCLKKWKNNTDIETLRKYRDIQVEMESYLHIIQDEQQFTPNKRGRFILILRNSIKDWLKDKYPDDYDYLSKALDVEFVKSATDEWQNGEIVYYFPAADKYITM